MRIGYGWDSHEFKKGVPLRIGGIRLDHDRGLAGHSDGDVLLHALTDALLGAIAAGDIGSFFPPTDPKWKGADSALFVAVAVEKIKEQEFAEKELALARSIQSRLLPPPELAGSGYRISARNLPARFVAGDFYDVFRLSDGALGVAVADVSGKGIGASLIMASVKAVLPLIAEGRGAAATLTELNRRLSGELAPREFVALAYARFQPESGRLELANAGLPDPYRLRPGELAEPLGAPGTRFPLGALRDTAYDSLSLTLAPGERLLFLTDGLPEAPTASGHPLGYEALAGLLPPLDGEPPGDMLERLFAAVREATQPTLEDDWTALVLEARTSEPP